MKFKDLLKKYDWKDIRTVILALYPDQEKSIDGYELALKELLILKPTKTKMCIVIEDEFDEDEQKRYHDVSAKDETKNKWAFDFIDWAECLNMEIDSKTFSKYSPIDIVVHCLWEMTWYGFTRKEVNKKANKLSEAARIAQKEVEEGKTVKWKEFFRRLEENEGRKRENEKRTIQQENCG